MPRILFTTAQRAHVADTSAPLIAITLGERGYRPVYIRNMDPGLLNPAGTTDAIIESAIAGSVFGWDCPAAQPALDFEAELAGRPGPNPDDYFPRALAV